MKGEKRYIMLFGLFKTKEEKKELRFLRALVRGQYKIFLDKDLIEHMLKKGFDINVQGYEGNTLLHWALLTKNDKMAEFLLKKGADASILNALQHSPFYIAAKKGKVKLMDLMLARCSKINIYSDSYNWTALHMAVREGWTDTTRFLLRKNVNINARNGLGKTPTHLAASRYHTGVLQELLKANPNLNAQDSEGNTPLHDAAMADTVSFKTIKMLLANGADPSIRNKAGLTPLQIAVNRQKMKKAEVLSNAEQKHFERDMPMMVQYPKPQYVTHQYVDYLSA